MYRRALLDFLDWHRVVGSNAFDRAAVQRYRALLLEARLAPSTINQKLSAIRALASEAADNGLLDPQLAAGVTRVRGVPSAGSRTGNWLSRLDAQRLLDAPNPATRKGVRDRAILAVLLGCGLRRSEIAVLTLAHVQQRDGPLGHRRPGR
jgi:site-specific recombinase XerD